MCGLIYVHRLYLGSSFWSPSRYGLKNWVFELFNLKRARGINEYSFQVRFPAWVIVTASIIKGFLYAIHDRMTVSSQMFLKFPGEEEVLSPDSGTDSYPSFQPVDLPCGFQAC